jgi:nucleoside-diphosphate-sugar epimerase
LKKLFVTGSSGLRGSQVAVFFCDSGWAIHGVDNNIRRVFYRPEGDTTWNRERLIFSQQGFHHHELDIEALAVISDISGKQTQYEYTDGHRKGDHICYVSDLTKIRANYPRWAITKDLRGTFEEIFQCMEGKMHYHQLVTEIGEGPFAILTKIVQQFNPPLILPKTV